MLARHCAFLSSDCYLTLALASFTMYDKFDG
jgi:hypothetical protein